MNSGPNQPSSGNGGRGRRRRRGRRAQGAQPQPQQQGQQGQRNSPGSSRRRSQPQAKRQHRPAMNQKLPDAGIYSAPMDHSYRTLQGGNGNGRTGRYHSNDTEAVSGATASNKPIYAFVDDLFFLAKIQETARKLNVKVEFVKNEKEVIDSIVNAEVKPSLIIFDLNNLNAKPLTTIPKLKSKLKKETNIIGFLNHLQGDLKAKATEAGCDMVVPRSAFSQNLPQLLRRHATEHEREAEV